MDSTRTDVRSGAGATRRSAVVVGAGISGLTAAHLLSRTHDVTLLEADSRFGGHAHTHRVPGSDGGELRIDSGFIVHNERTYPHLLRLFAELGVRTRQTEMSMSITCDGCGLSYAGGRGLPGLLAQPRRAVEPRFLGMLADVPRFHRLARRVLDGRAAHLQDASLGDVLAAGGFGEYFVRHFAIPLVSCVWSAGDLDATAYPARHLFQFLDHHGMLAITGSPTWRTVVGGSAAYVDAIVARLRDSRARVPVRSLTRHEDGVDVRTADGGLHQFDVAVVATHADQALDLLADATPAEKEDLGAIGYSVNETWLHRDASLLPARRARSSWNYRMASCSTPADKVCVSYWMNRLQGLDDSADHLVTLNAPGRVAPHLVTARMRYEHPVFTHAAVAAGARLREAGGPRLAFAGAHLGWGFHEDGCRSGVEAAGRFGGRW
jgi:predicted NAD/FAD-binding protein